MKFAFFIDKLKNGGAERVTSILANYFSKNNEVYIFLVDNTNIDYYINESVTIIKVPFSDNKFKRMWLRQRFVVNMIKKTNFDACITLTYTFLPYILSAPRKSRGKVISSLRNAPQYELSGTISKIMRWIGFALCDNVVFQTDDAKNYFSSKVRNKGIVIPNPISNNLPSAAIHRDKNIVMATRLESQKNIPLAIEAFRIFQEKHNDWRLEIYGRGALQSELEELIEGDPKTKSSICIYDFCKEIHQVISQCGMFLMSSDFEGLSNSMIEAMGIGIPVICTDCPIGGPKMMIKHGENGLLVPVGDPYKMAEMMAIIADDPEYGKKLGDKATEIKGLLSADKICAQWYSIATR